MRVVGYLKSGFWQLLSVLLFIVLLFGMDVYAQENTPCDAGSHLVTHALGETCIAENPQRVVVLDTGELDNALSLGAPVVGAPTTDALQYQAYLSDQLDGIADTGLISEPNFEAILALAPDLILGSKQRYEAIYPQLSEIAPTVFTESLRVPWQDNFRLHAVALGKTAEAEQLLVDYEAHIAEVQAVLGDALDSTTISIIRFRPGQVRLYLKSSYIGYILQDVGLQRPPSQDQDVFSAEISIEEMQQADADYIFVTGYDVEDSERATFLDSQLWQTLDAVQNGRVIDVNDDTWIAGLGVQAANLVLDDLESLLAPTILIQCDPGFRLFTHELLWSETPDGVCIPENPQRIAFAWSFHVPALLRAGVPLAGVGDRSYLLHEFPEWQTAIEAIPEIGEPPNLEVTLGLQPDLIIEPSWAATDNYDQISAIAPTVVFQFDGTHQWKQLAQMYFDIAGKSDAYDELISEYEARADELGELIGHPQDIEISLVAVWGPSRIYTDYSPGGMVVADVGFSRPAVQVLQQTPEEVIAAGEYPFFFPLPLEEIQKAEGDFIIAFGDFDSEEGAALRQELEKHPLWQTLEAVKTGNVYFTTVNWAGGDIAGAHAILDDLAKAFGVFDQLSPNPYKTPIVE